MGLSLKQPKDVLVLFFGIAGLILVVFPLFMMIVLKKGVLKILAGSSREDQEYEAQSFFSCSLSTGRNKIAKEELTSMKINKILCPVDFSESSEQALKYATFLAWTHSSKLCLLHVMKPGYVFDGHMMSYTPPEIRGKLENEVENQLSSLVIRVEECINIETDILEGKAFVEIIRKAREDNVDLIVMGNYGRSGLEHILIGSVAEKVTRKAPCPVLVVNTNGTEF